MKRDFPRGAREGRVDFSCESFLFTLKKTGHFSAEGTLGLTQGKAVAQLSMTVHAGHTLMILAFAISVTQTQTVSLIRLAGIA
jgi:hypothetical protein